jgi:hypothetical protein
MHGRRFGAGRAPSPDVRCATWHPRCPRSGDGVMRRLGRRFGAARAPSPDVHCATWHPRRPRSGDGVMRRLGRRFGAARAPSPDVHSGPPGLRSLGDDCAPASMPALVIYAGSRGTGSPSRMQLHSAAREKKGRVYAVQRRMDATRSTSGRASRRRDRGGHGRPDVRPPPGRGGPAARPPRPQACRGHGWPGRREVRTRRG